MRLETETLWHPDLDRPDDRITTTGDVLPGLRVVLVTDSDKSDPLNQLLCLSLNINHRVGARVLVPRELSDPMRGFVEAVAAMVTLAIKQHGELLAASAAGPKVKT